MADTILKNSIVLLGKQFSEIDWKYESNKKDEKIQLWPGEDNEDVMICVYKGNQMLETFHQQNFFFFNFAYKGSYSALSELSNRRITIQEGECYIGQPYAGYAINDQSEDETIIVGILIQKEAFFKTFFHVLSSDQKLFEFFLNPQLDEYSKEYIHLHFENDYSIRNLLNLMMVEYADKKEDTQSILKPLTLTLLMEVAREYKKTQTKTELSLAEQLVVYIGENFDHVTLNELSRHFSYHPNYLSSLLSKEIGKSFSEILLEQRMQRAVSLLHGTKLPISEITTMLGYTNTSNFYKAFREYYHMSPRDYIANNHF